MTYKTGKLITSQRLRRNLGELLFFESDPAVGFGIDKKNVLTGLNTVHSTEADKLVVPASFFNTTNYADKAAAEAAFISAFVGINLTHPELGKREKVPVAQECDVEFACTAAKYVAGEMLTWVWDATNEWVDPMKFAKTTDISKAIAYVVETAPIAPVTGNVTRITGRIKRLSFVPSA